MYIDYFLLILDTSKCEFINNNCKINILTDISKKFNYSYHYNSEISLEYDLNNIIEILQNKREIIYKNEIPLKRDIDYDYDGLNYITIYNFNSSNIYHFSNDFLFDVIDDKNFSFGKNWTEYSTNLTNEHIDKNLNHIINTLEKINYSIMNKTILEIGCGSGINVLSMLKLNPKYILAFDYDIHSVECSKKNLEKFNLNNYKIEQGDILDEKYLSDKKEYFDMIYCFGVLHHTGNMFKAIQNTISLCKPGGYIHLGLYSGISTFHKNQKMKIKYFYGDKYMKNFIACDYLNFYKKWEMNKGVSINNINWKKEKERGMLVLYDILDWCGGFPYEVIDFDTLNSFISSFKCKIVSHFSKEHAVNEYILYKSE